MDNHVSMSSLIGKIHYWLILAMGGCFTTVVSAKLVLYPAPKGMAVTTDFTVTIDGRPLDLYTVETFHGGSAFFANFDFSGSVDVVVHSRRPAAGTVIRPAQNALQLRIENNDIIFTLNHPGQLTIEVDGIERVLHLFANPIETHPPKAGAPGVIYFGPGVYDVTGLKLTNNSTLYIAGGAVLRAHQSTDGHSDFIDVAEATGVRICGRGIIDLGGVPHHTQKGIVLTHAENISLEGITLLDAPDWTLAIFGCRNVRIDNIKEICRRVNSDGIDICNSQKVVVENCFLRNNDDEICVKTTAPAPAPVSKDILVQHCVVWNERARGLGITSETQRDISDVTFADCDIIHDYSQNADCAAMAVLVSDSGWMRNIRFENIRVADVKVLFRCWVGRDVWGHDPERGHIDGLVFRNISVTDAYSPTSDLIGFDATHLIENVRFENLTIQNKAITNLEQGAISTNAFVRNIRFYTGH
jgi:polygalacturonase